jgi:hypothetical protein
MKLVLFRTSTNSLPSAGVITDQGIVDISKLVGYGATPQDTMVSIIDRFDDLKPKIQEYLVSAKPLDTASMFPSPDKLTLVPKESPLAGEGL